MRGENDEDHCLSLEDFAHMGCEMGLRPVGDKKRGDMVVNYRASPSYVRGQNRVHPTVHRLGRQVSFGSATGPKLMGKICSSDFLRPSGPR
jgi:hypothetical protein